MANGTISVSQVDVLTTSGTGTISIVPPATNTNRTLTLPDATGTILTSATTTGFPAGSVVQVVSATTTTSTNTTSTSYVATNLAASITPKSSSNKVLVLFNITCGKNGSSGVYLAIYRGASSIAEVAANIGDDGTANNTNNPPMGACYLDSPSTTSSTTYTIYIKSGSGTSTAKSVINSGVAMITLMEIAA